MNINPYFILICIGLYFMGLLAISYFTTKKTSTDGYFLGNKKSPWIAVAFGMIGDSLSGVTFISVPGAIYYGKFAYLQLVLGYIVGYFIISRILLPIYYKNNLLSIYEYLAQRFGVYSQQIGAFFFFVSRLLGAGGRLFLAVNVLQLFVFDQFNVPFALAVFIIIALILIYTYKGGIKTLVWTDVFQSGFLILAVILSIVTIASALNLNFQNLVLTIKQSEYSQIFFLDFEAKNFVLKNFLGGLFIAVSMTGLDQNMMQKNLSCKSLTDAQKNMEWFSIVLVIVNVFFVSLGALLYVYANQQQIPLPINEDKVITDNVFPLLALNHLGLFAGLVFIIGLTAATFSSADSVLTTLTTTVYVDFLKYDKTTQITEAQKVRRRTLIHIAIAFVLLLIILLFKMLNNKAIIDTILIVAGYTYGPLLALFSIGLFSNVKLMDKRIPIICIIAPFVTFYITSNIKQWTGGYEVGHELILLNAIICIILLLMFTSNRSFAKNKI